MAVVEFVHECFGEVENAEADVDGSVEVEGGLVHIDGGEVFREDAKGVEGV